MLGNALSNVLGLIIQVTERVLPMATNFELPTALFGEIIWRPEANYVRQSLDYGDKKATDNLISAMAKVGWLQTPNGMVKVQAGAKVPNWEQLIEAELKARQEELSKLASDALRGQEYLVKKEAWLTEKGKLIVPRWDGVTGNRRSKIYIISQIQRLSLLDEETKQNMGLKPIWTVPIMVGDYSDVLTRIRAQNEENDKDLGRLKTNPIDKLLTARRMMQCGLNQTKIRSELGATDGVKAFWWITLSNMFPDLRLIDRCLLKDTNDPSYIPYTSIRHDRLQSMGQRLTEADTQAYNADRVKKQQDTLPMFCKEELEQYIRYVRGETGEKPSDELRMMDKNAVVALKNGHDNELLREVCDAIRFNRGEQLNKMPALAPACNAINHFFNVGDLPLVEKIILRLRELEHGEMRNAAIKACYIALGLESIKASQPEVKEEVEEVKEDKKRNGKKVTV